LGRADIAAAYVHRPVMTQAGHRQSPLAVPTVFACLRDLPLL
jgi:hypothetical protein